MIAKWKPNRFVCLGDEIDCHAMSNYEHNPDGYSPGHELAKALKFMKQLYKIMPECSVAISNHTSRPFRKAYKHGIPRAFMKDYREFMEAPAGWRWESHWIIDGVRYEHGDAIGGMGYTATKRFPLRNGQSSVFGHFHAHAGTLGQANPNNLLFGANAGCLLDRHAYAFEYWKQPERPVVGAVIVDNGLPIFVPMQLKKGGRWNGKV
jgi:hypothetical protein